MTNNNRDKVGEAEWKYLDVNEHWQQMKIIMNEPIVTDLQ